MYFYGEQKNKNLEEYKKALELKDKDKQLSDIKKY